MANNVIVDELLCFISNKLQILATDEIIKLCIIPFTDINIKDSKLKFFNACNRGPQHMQPATGIKYQVRKGTKSTEANLKDIIGLFQELGTNAPTFAAVNLQRLPDLWDVNALIGMISQLTATCHDMKRTVDNNTSLINTLQLSFNDNAIRGNALAEAARSSYAAAVGSQPPAPLRRSSSVDPDGPSEDPSQAENNVNGGKVINTGQDTANKDGEWENQRSGGRGRGRRKRPMKAGRHVANNDSAAPNILGVKRDKVANIFVTRLTPTCTSDDVKLHILRNLNLDANVTKIENTRNAEYYSSFHISCKCDDPSKFYDEKLWPEHVFFRRWYPKRNARPPVGVLET